MAGDAIADEKGVAGHQLRMARRICHAEYGRHAGVAVAEYLRPFLLGARGEGGADLGSQLGHALCTPYQWTKQVASHWGGTRNGTIVHWPNGIVDKGEIRSQFHHVIDVAKTILEAAGLPEPTVVNSITQAPLEGVSMLPTLRDGDAPEHHDVQYFEILGNRGIYHKGWTAVTKHRTPWTTEAPPAFDDDVWELYGPDDWTQAHDLVKENPQKLAEMQRLWLIEAVKYNVVPLDDRTFERFNPDIAGLPS